MVLGEYLERHTRNIILVDGSGKLLTCSTGEDQEAHKAVGPYVHENVRSAVPSGTYLLIALEKEVA